MQIKDRPEYKRKGQILTMAPGDSVASAVAVMSERNYGAVVIVSPDDIPLGIVTERDFMRRLLAKGLDPNSTQLQQIMTTDLKVAKPEDELLDWLRQMSNDRFRHVPIVGEDGRIINIMSQGDFVSYTWPQLIGRLTEQAKASFELSPSIFLVVGGAVIFMLVVIAAILSISGRDAPGARVLAQFDCPFRSKGAGVEFVADETEPGLPGLPGQDKHLVNGAGLGDNAFPGPPPACGRGDISTLARPRIRRPGSKRSWPCRAGRGRGCRALGGRRCGRARGFR